MLNQNTQPSPQDQADQPVPGSIDAAQRAWLETLMEGVDIPDHDEVYHNLDDDIYPRGGVLGEHAVRDADPAYWERHP